MPEHSPHPTQTDFALVTINESEDKAVRDVFREDTLKSHGNTVGDRGLYTWWAMNNWDSSDRYVVVHASTGDVKGPLPAIELIRELDRLFKPRFLLILGTAGGIRDRGIEYGRVVFSRQVHVGYQQLLDRGEADVSPCKVEVRLFDDPVQPPSDRLYMHAKKAAVGWAHTARMKEASVDAVATLTTRLDQLAAGADEKPEEKEKKEKEKEAIENTIKAFLSNEELPAEATEIYSGPYLVDGKNSELFSCIKTTFPKVGAIEMEAGAVGQAVLHSIDTEHFIGYLVIKGISDVVDSKVPKEDRKFTRKVLSHFASLASAEFAKRMIEEWRGNTGQRYGELGLIPPKYSSFVSTELWGKRHSNSVVYDGITLDRYSQLLEKICKADRSINSAWTFCYLAPYRFFAALDSESPMNQQSVEQVHKRAMAVLALYKNDKETLRSKLLEKFPHFNVFLELAKRNKRKKNKSKPDKIVRILHTGKGWVELNRPFLKDFAALNADLQCLMLDDLDLDGEEWARKDQVILNDELLFDFDEEGRRLTITSLDYPGLGTEFARFRDHCKTKGKSKDKDFQTQLPAMLRPVEQSAKQGTRAPSRRRRTQP
jgi:nucleoside phosphorylase